jgi:hypothetical protein
MRDITEALQPAHSSDLIQCDFHLWGSLEDKCTKQIPTHHKTWKKQEEMSRISQAGP